MPTVGQSHAFGTVPPRIGRHRLFSRHPGMKPPLTYIDDPDRNRSQRSLADVASAEIIRAVDLEDLLQLIVALFKPVMALVRKEVNGVGQLERPLGVAALHLALVIAHAQENRVPANGQAT